MCSHAYLSTENSIIINQNTMRFVFFDHKSLFSLMNSGETKASVILRKIMHDSEPHIKSMYLQRSHQHIEI